MQRINIFRQIKYLAIKKNILSLALLLTSTIINAQGTWSPKSPQPDYRSEGNGFSIGLKGYLTCGSNSAGILQNDLWEYNSVNNSWTQKASLPGITRNGAIAFAIGTKAYVGCGQDAAYNKLNDM